MGCQSPKKKKWQNPSVDLDTFKKVYRKTRMGRNQQTGKQIKIKGKNVVTFKAVTTLREKNKYGLTDKKVLKEPNTNQANTYDSKNEAVSTKSLIVQKEY